MNQANHFLIFISILVVMVIVFVTIENLYWRAKLPSKVYSLKEVLVNFGLGASYKLVDFIALAVYVFFIYDLIRPYGLKLTIDNAIVNYIVLFILVDLGFYFVHVCMHKVRLFWLAHVTHHSSLRYNFSTALRQNLLVSVNGVMLLWWVPIALVGFSKEQVLLGMEINLLYQFLIHTEMPTPLWDKFGRVLNTPSHHRVHHGSNPDQIDRNFGGTFIIWDRIFGTFRAEQDVGEIKYGISDREFDSWNPITLIFHELIALTKDCVKYKSLKFIVKQPGWLPNKKSKTQAESKKVLDS